MAAGAHRRRSLEPFERSTSRGAFPKHFHDLAVAPEHPKTG